MAGPVVVFNKQYARPGCEEVVGSALCRVADRVRALPGCRFFRVHRSVSDPAHFMVVGSWDSEEHFDEFLRLPWVIQFLDQILPLNSHPLDVAVMHEIG